MTERSLRRMVWAVWAISVSMPLLRVILQLVGILPAPADASEITGEVAFLAIAIGLATLGALVVSRQARHPIGWIFVGAGFVAGLVRGAETYATHASGSLPGAPVAAWFANLAAGPWEFGLFAFVFLLFPDGHLASPRWRPVAWAAATAMALLIAGDAVRPGPFRSYPAVSNPFGIGALDPVLRATPIAFLVLLATLLAAAASLVLRFRHSRGDQRQQLKWVASATVLAAILVLSGPIFWFVVPAGLAWLWTAAFALAVASIPSAIGIAMLKYRLYDIDLLINRTLVYGALTAGVVGLYVLVVGYLGTVFQAGNNLLISLMATGLVAVVFQPLRERLQRAVNRLLYGERDEPYTVLSRLGQRLEGTLAPEAVLPTVVQTVREALRLPYAAVTLRHAEGLATAVEVGTPGADALRLSLVYQGEPVGELRLGPRARGEPFSPADRRLLEDLARQAGVAVHAMRLTADLQRSRERLVSAREEERRRLRRDLHDGLGPTLGAQRLKVGSARALYAHDPTAADALLAELEADLGAALADIRRLVYDLRPPALDELGLVGAIRQAAAPYAGRGDHAGGANGDRLRVEVVAPDWLPSLPAAVEVAAYRIAQEALTNVVRHAHARTCQIRLSLEETALRVAVADDGVGLPEPRVGRPRHTGVGLVSMRERAEELGGTCQVETPREGGTRVLARLPVPQGTTQRAGAAAERGSPAPVGAAHPADSLRLGT